MATTKSSRRAPARKRAPAKRKPPSKPPRKAGGRHQASRVREAARTQLRGHGTDALALAVLVVGLLTGLALATDLTGPVGAALADGITALLGNGAFLIPTSLVVVAVLLLWRRPEDESPAAPLRVGLGVGLVVLAAAGLLHVLGGAPGSEDPSTGCATPAGISAPASAPRSPPVSAPSARRSCSSASSSSARCSRPGRRSARSWPG